MNNSNTSKRWFVFYTYPKFEGKVDEYLKQKNFESFLPLCWVVKQWSDRKKRMKAPLLPSYIFVNIEHDKIYEVLKTPRIIRCVTFNRIPAYLKQKEIDNIKQIMENEYPFELRSNLNIGDSVMITKGPLTGMEGVLVEERGNQRFALRLELLQQSVLVNVPFEYLEYISVLV